MADTIVLMNYDVLVNNRMSYSPCIELGTKDSYGLEQIKIIRGEGWTELEVLAVFNTPGGAAIKKTVGADGVLEVPPEATAGLAGQGKIVFVGLAEDKQRITADLAYSIRDHSGIDGDNPGTPTPDVVQQILENSNNAVRVAQAAKDAAEKTRIWEARRVAIPALARCRPTLMLEDATVPRSKIPAMIKALDEIAARHNVTIATFGHAGDGNLHPSILCDRRDKEEFSRVERAVDDLFNAALELGGTLSGEHGIGTAKIKWLEQETSHGTIMFSRRLRKAFDPKGLFNPSKIVGFGD